MVAPALRVKPQVASRTGRIPAGRSSVNGFLGVGLAIGLALYVASGHETAFFFFMVWMVVGCVAYAVSDFEASLCLFAFAIPLDQALFIWGQGRFNTLTYLALVLAIVGFAHSWRNSSFRRPSRTEMLAGLWLLWGAITLFWTLEARKGMGILLTDLGGLLVIIIYTRGLKSERAVVTCLWYFIAGTALLSLILLRDYEPGAAYVWREYRYVAGVLGGGSGIAPYEFARAACMSAIAALAVWEWERTRLRRSVGFALALFSALVVVLTVVRGPLIALSIGLLAWAFFSQPAPQRLKRIVVIAILTAITGASAWQINSESLGQRYGDTAGWYAQGNSTRLTSGRSEIWAGAWDLFLRHPLEGVGLGSFPTAYSQLTGDIPRDSHNAYIGQLAEKGIIGFVLFFALMASIGYSAFIRRDWRNISVAWWSTSALVIASGGLMRGKEVWIVWAIILFLGEKRAASPGWRAPKRKGKGESYSRAAKRAREMLVLRHT